MQSNDLIQTLLEYASRFGMNVLGAVAILVLGFWGIRLLKRPLAKALSSTQLDPTIVQFLASIIGYALLAFVVIASLSRLGIQTSSFVALIGAAGLAVGLALEGSLANFAAGILLAFFRPLRVGDFVDAADSEGVVEKITIFHTTIKTLDNETIVLPNSEVTSGKITNYSGEPYVRIEVPLVVGHDADFATVVALLHDVPSRCKRVLAEPPAEVQVTDLSGEWLGLQLEVSVEPLQREDAGFEVAEQIKRAFDKAGIEPPRRQVKMSMDSRVLPTALE